VAPPIAPNATRWQIRINGLPVFARGGNWIPRDQLFGRGIRNRSRTTKILLAAKHAGITWMRIWGGGLIEDQHFYRECDRLGLMLLQEFPHAGCAPGGPGDSFPDYATRLSLDDTQTRMALKQLVNHPSIIRYNYANEFYLNSSVSPFIAQFLSTVRSIDDSRPVHEANPTCVAIRHGPYTFSEINYATYGLECGNGTAVEPWMAGGVAGCAGQGENGGNPFEWDEFGATGLSDVDTLRAVIPPAELGSGWQTGATPSWAFHRLVEW
jgi:beta-mannosidase